MRQLPAWIQNAHPLDNVLSDRGNGMVTRRRLVTKIENVCYTSHIEPKSVTKALNSELCVLAMQKKLAQFK